MFDPSQQAAAAAPGAPAGAASQPDGAQQAPAICIQPQADGSYLVYSDDQGPDAGQPAQDINTALQMAKQLLTGAPAGAAAGGDGDPDDAGGPSDNDGDAAEALFQQGFKGARGALGR